LRWPLALPLFGGSEDRQQGDEMNARWPMFAVLALAMTSPLRAQEASTVGRYQIAPGANGAVWRLDTATGELELCDMSAEWFPYITCSGVTRVVKNPRAIATPPPADSPNPFDRFDPDKQAPQSKSAKDDPLAGILDAPDKPPQPK
jgi:hypothetical protein